jgi:hypothetical protein
VRSFAARYIYSKEVYTDFFAISLLLSLQAIVSISFLFYWQVQIEFSNLLFPSMDFWPMDEGILAHFDDRFDLVRFHFG